MLQLQCTVGFKIFIGGFKLQQLVALLSKQPPNHTYTNMYKIYLHAAMEIPMWSSTQGRGWFKPFPKSYWNCVVNNLSTATEASSCPRIVLKRCLLKPTAQNWLVLGFLNERTLYKEDKLSCLCIQKYLESPNVYIAEIQFNPLNPTGRYSSLHK